MFILPAPWVAGRPRVAGAKAQVLEEILKTLVAAQDPQWLVLLTRCIDDPDTERQSTALRVASLPVPAVVGSAITGTGA